METAGVRLVAEGANAFNQQLERAAKGVTDFGKNAESASRGIDLMNVATVAFGTALGELATRGFDAITGAINNFIGSGWEYNKSIENATAQLVAFTGSQEAAAAALDLVERKASSTPFTFDEMAQSAASLSATSRSTGESLEDLIDLSTRLAASNPSEGLEGAAFALREAFSGDFMSLQERFNIGKADIARIKEMGVSVESLDQVLGELGITTELVSGLAGTFDGRMSTLKDTFTQLAGAFTAPIFETFSKGLGLIQGEMNANLPAWMETAKGAGQLVADSFQTGWEAWMGQWKDDDVIHPLHRLVGNTTVEIKKAWDALMTFGEEQLPILKTQLGDIEKAWGPLNELWDTTVFLFDELGRLADALFAAFGRVEEETGKANKQFGRANTLGSELAGVFANIERAVKGIADVIGFVADGLERAAGAGGFDLNPFDNTPAAAPGVPPMDTGGGGTIDNSPLPPATSPMPPVQGPPTSAPPSSPNPTNRTTINSTIIIPAGVSPATASKIVGDGILQAQRSRGMA